MTDDRPDWYRPAGDTPSVARRADHKDPTTRSYHLMTDHETEQRLNYARAAAAAELARRGIQPPPEVV